MGIRCVEDSVEYRLKQVVKRFVQDFDNKEDAIEAIQQGDHIEQFLTYLWDDMNSYIDIEDLIKAECRSDEV